MDEGSLAGREVVWQPASGPQRALLSCPVFEAFFGGARGGGKTDGILGEWAQHASEFGENAIGLIVRRTRLQLTETFERAKALYRPVGTKFTEVPMRCIMPGGARLNFAYLERDADAENYQGHSYTRVYIEEAGNFPSITPVLKLMATLRSGAGVPCRIRLTGNPGGPGHQWIKARYIDPAPQGWEVQHDPDSGLDRVYIPSRVSDNPFLGEDYIRQLRQLGDPVLVRAWLEGDFSVVAGAFFPEFSLDMHVIAPRSLPAYWLRFRSLDWGSARPFSVGWWAVSDGELPEFPRGALVRYREWYGASAPNVGLRMVAEEVADGIKEREKGDIVGHGRSMGGVADPAIYAEDGGPSIADRIASRGVHFRPADNKRVAQHGALGGWDQLRARLKGDGETPGIFFFSTCRDLIRTLPALQHDSDRPEDVDTDAEDHAPDECFVASTLIETDRGPSPIAQVMVGDRVATRVGLRAVVAAFSVGEREVFDVSLSDGTKLTGTANHPVWVEGKGFISLRNLRYGDMMRPCKSPSSTTQSKSFWAFGISSAEATTRTRAGGFTASCGRPSTVAFRAALTFTTRITTNTITGLKTWSAFVARTICPITVGYALATPKPVSPFMPDRARPNGTDRPRVENGTSSTLNGTAGAPSSHRSSNTHATNAARPFEGDHSLVFAPTHASQHGDAPLGSMMLNADAMSVVRHSLPTAIRTSDIARGSVITKSTGNTSGGLRTIAAAIVALFLRPRMRGQFGAPTVAGEPTTAGRQTVYNLSVDEAEEYFANGVLVHNCRYACMSRPYTAPLPASLDPPVRDRYARSWRPARVRGSPMAA